MPFKDEETRKAYMKKYMREYRALQRQIIKQYRIKFPKIDAQVRKDLGFKKRKKRQQKKGERK